MLTDGQQHLPARKQYGRQAYTIQPFYFGYDVRLHSAAAIALFIAIAFERSFHFKLPPRTGRNPDALRDGQTAARPQPHKFSPDTGYGNAASAWLCIMVNAPTAAATLLGWPSSSRPRLFSALSRERLFALLDEQRAHPLIWVDGPPGASKTTLVASYLESRRLRALWYHVDGGDADPDVLLLPGPRRKPELPAKHKPLPLLTPEYLNDLTGFSRRFFRGSTRACPRPAVLVLDNYDEVLGEMAFHALLVDSAQEIPDGINVMIVSRSEPPACIPGS
jgi:hypothetical protein